MTFTPCLCSTPKFVPVANQPLHFILAAPIVLKGPKQRELVKSTNNSYCRPLKKCHHRYHSKQSNASTAINRQHIFFCLPFNLFHLSKRRRHGPCHV
jgi:hypothetical protein